MRPGVTHEGHRDDQQQSQRRRVGQLRAAERARGHRFFPVVGPAMLERGTDIRIIQALLGHNKLDTTARYTRVATGMIACIESPLDLLSQPRKKPKKSRKDPPPV